MAGAGVGLDVTIDPLGAWLARVPAIAACQLRAGMHITACQLHSDTRVRGCSNRPGHQRRDQVRPPRVVTTSSAVLLPHVVMACCVSGLPLPAPPVLSCLMVHSSDDDRAGFVKNLCETVYNNDQINGQYNVMVFNLSQDYDKSLNDVVFYGSGSTDGRLP